MLHSAIGAQHDFSEQKFNELSSFLFLNPFESTQRNGAAAAARVKSLHGFSAFSAAENVLWGLIYNTPTLCKLSYSAGH